MQLGRFRGQGSKAELEPVLQHRYQGDAPPGRDRVGLGHLGDAVHPEALPCRRAIDAVQVVEAPLEAA
eukprot:6854282-Lingulodinium_polyedra.AAC.1